MARVRETLEGLVASSTGVEQRVGVVYEAQEHAQSFLEVDERGGYGGYAWIGSSLARVVVRSLMALFLRLNHAALIVDTCCEEWNAVLVLAATNVRLQRNVPDGGCTPLLLLIAFQGSNGASRSVGH